MDVIEELLAATGARRVRCGVSAHAAPTAEQLALEFRLRPEAAADRRIARASAERVIEGLLHRDLAYGAEWMPLAQAADLAVRFVALFDAPETVFYTNLAAHGGSWAPATEATFDGGVLAVGALRSGCFWVEDED